jgi:hypothetical protein
MNGIPLGELEIAMIEEAHLFSSGRGTADGFNLSQALTVDLLSTIVGRQP